MVADEVSAGRRNQRGQTPQQLGGLQPLLSAAGYGQYHPIVPNDSPENRSQNRRIEIVLAPAG